MITRGISKNIEIVSYITRIEELENALELEKTTKSQKLQTLEKINEGLSNIASRNTAVINTLTDQLDELRKTRTENKKTLDTERQIKEAISDELNNALEENKTLHKHVEELTKQINVWKDFATNGQVRIQNLNSKIRELVKEKEEITKTEERIEQQKIKKRKTHSGWRSIFGSFIPEEEVIRIDLTTPTKQKLDVAQ